MCSTLPNIYYFNPTCEIAIANGTVSWQASSILNQFETDIELIAAFLASPDDILLMRKLPSQKHINQLNDLGITLPKLLLFSEAINDRNFLILKKGFLNPWGWSSTMLHKFKPIIESCSTDFQNSPSANWNKLSKELYSRKVASKILENLIQKNIPQIVTKEIIPKVCYSIEEIKSKHLLNKQSIVKAPWSSSGRGIHVVDSPNINPTILRKCQKILKEQGYLMVEPLLNKIIDFSFQFEIKEDTIRYSGTSWFYTNDSNAYRGNYLKKEFARIPKECKKLLSKVETEIISLLSAEIEANYLGKYQGMLSVDAMFIKTKTNELLLHPCVEINIRYNMSNVANSLAHLSKKGFKAFEINTIQEYKLIDHSKTYLLTKGEKFCAYLKQ
ncbi:MAG: hypothetical protein PF541_16630 [Prolixibacteraceae bacterium]|jgi:hypothetical protein|nr:hypothetical protein [Prolixibacteraceae bacterium]